MEKIKKDWIAVDANEMYQQIRRRAFPEMI
jgi:hypothetical protein